MLDNLKLSEKLIVAHRWFEDSRAGKLPPITEHPRVFLQLLEECRDQAAAMEAPPSPPADERPGEAGEHLHPVSSVYVPDDPSRGFLQDMARPPVTKGRKIVDLVRFRRLLATGGGR